MEWTKPRINELVNYCGTIFMSVPVSERPTARNGARRLEIMSKRSLPIRSSVPKVVMRALYGASTYASRGV